VGSSLVALGGALVATGLLGRLGRRIGLPTIPLFMLAGVVFGPHTPGLHLVHDPGELELVATIGLVLLLFYLGLELSIDELLRGGRRLLLASGLFLVVNFGAGAAFGAVLGWGSREVLVIAGAVGISSSAIITKLLVELNRLSRPETRVILALIVLEDLFLAVYLALLQPLLHDTAGAADALLSIGKAVGFLVALVLVARFGATAVGRMLDTDDNELLTIGFVGLAVLVAGLAEEFGVSAAIGSFLIGMVLAKSPNHDRIAGLVHPIRDVFGALFFYAFGVAIDPGDVASVAGPIAAAIVLTALCTFGAGALVARLYRFDRAAAWSLAFTTLARGELSLIVAALAAGAGLDERIGPFVAGYVLLLAVIAPLLVANAAPRGRRRDPTSTPSVHGRRE
jgi:CPA2 family monovalent cation:H+ antiporter-2